eukprot:TRINITY_DN5383_c0_g1_i1.p1 TRINITY_DN5383_c0_g1~~TRINITY_DN5383_c0_g1_i1.p1  ORF type:complete len:116 (-),score=28.96 TRINITY_DN5383_c0_g1_i1:140-487(-)
MFSKESLRRIFSKHDHDKDDSVNLVELVDILEEILLRNANALDIMQKYGKSGHISWLNFEVAEREQREEQERAEADNKLMSELQFRGGDDERMRSSSVIYRGDFLEIDEDEDEEY